MSTSLAGRLAKAAANFVLDATRLGDGLKATALRPGAGTRPASG
jgi:hypothetical protein